MSWISKTIIYQVVLLLAAIAGLVHYKRMDKASRLLVWFICSTFLSEAIAVWFALKYGNSLIVYHIYNPLQLFLIALYFNFEIEYFHRKKIGWYLGIGGIMLSIFNSVFLQSPFKVIDSNFLITESFIIIGLCLYSFYSLLLEDSVEDFFDNRFWFSSLLLIFWSFTFCYWLIGPTIYKTSPKTSEWINVMIWVINVLCYSGFAIVFLSFRKMKRV